MAQEPGATPLLPKSVIEEHVRALRSGNETQKERAAGELAALASPDRNNAVLVEAGAVAPLVDATRSGSSLVKARAVAALTSLTFDSSVHLVRAGCIEPLVELMRSCGDLNGADMNAGFIHVGAGRALRNLLRTLQNCTQTQDAIRAAGDIPLLVELARENITWEFAHPAFQGLHDLARDNDDNQVAIALAEGGVVALVKLTRYGIFWGPGARIHGHLWCAGPDAKARAIAARMLAERREGIVHKCVGAALPPEMVSLVAAFLRPRWETSSRRTKWRASESKA